MSTDVVMPRMGETVDEGTVNVWPKAVGDQVAEGEPLVEIGTDKVDTDIPAPVSGTLAEIRVEADQTVPVGTVIAVISAGPGRRPPGALRMPPGFGEAPDGEAQ